MDEFTSDSVDLGREVDAAKVGWTLVWLSAGALLRVALAAAFVVAFTSEEWDSVDLEERWMQPRWDGHWSGCLQAPC